MLFWRNTGVAEGSFWISLGLLSLLPYAVTLVSHAGTIDSERRMHLWRSLNRSDLQTAGARLIWVLLPWSLSVGMAACAIWPARARILRGGEYDSAGVLFGWSGECLMLAALLLCLRRVLSAQTMLPIASLIFMLHFLIDPVLVVAAKASGKEPYAMNHAMHQAVMTWRGGIVFYALAMLLGGLYFYHCTRRAASDEPEVAQ
ncbi:MAG: hypothetical protein O2782_21885 [bacterium]|nr:hypothetical protein [bacterium]